MDINLIKKESLNEINRAKNLKDLEQLFKKYLGKKGLITLFLRTLKDLSDKKRKKQGSLANQIKKEIDGAIKKKSKKFSAKDKAGQGRQEEWIDVSAPGILPSQGYLHPITLVQRQIEEIFQSMGFAVAEGPEMETEYYNFDALNIPPDHPARDVWDTFWIKEQKNKLLLRTHTSPVQIRYMKKNNPPLRIIVPGRCFRHEATDASHDIQFHQIEGLMIDKNISVANFREVVEGFLKKFFGSEVKMRLRPGYFPFVEPGFEIDIKRKDKDWLEIMGAGMVHPNVFKAVGYNPKNWQGFAFGVGLDRLAMLKYKINDIRLLYSGDLRFLKQF